MACCTGPKNGPGVPDLTKEQVRQQMESIRLLLLGAGDVGKSTFLRQVRVLHGTPFEKAELDKFSVILPLNALNSMKSLIRGYMLTGKKIPSKLKDDITKIGEADALTEEIATSIDTVWKAESIKKTFERRSELKIQIPGCANYYFDNVLRYAESTFVATKEDIMHCKLKTTGTQELKFEIGGRLFSITDVGGQRSERRKWLFVFTGVRAVIFLVRPLFPRPAQAALDEYDLVLEEDDKTNRFTESLDLFRTVTGSQFLEKSSWILFLNKSDLLREKLPKYPLNRFFNDISEKDGGDFDAAVKYLQQKFVKSWKGKTELFHFITCNVNTELTDKTFQSVRSMLVSDALEDAGF